MADLQRVQAEEMQNQDNMLDIEADVQENQNSFENLESDDSSVQQENDIADSKDLNLQGFHNRSLIFVMSGIHKGAGCSVQDETTIGSDFDNDLILTDDDIAPRHLVLIPIEEGLNYSIKVICKGENIVINGKVLLTNEQTLTMQETFVVTIGMVSINITVHKATKTTIVYKKYITPKIRAVEALGNNIARHLSPSVIISDIRNIFLLLCVFILFGISLTYYFTREMPKQSLQSSHDAFKNIKSLSIKETSDSLLLNVQAKNDLKHLFKKYDLNGRLHLFIKKRVVYVEGNINNYELQNWSKALSWFDTAYGAKVNLVPLITINNGLRRTISFKAVVAHGSMPYVVSWTGDRFKLGATLPGGWIILKIGDDGVTVKDAVDNRIFLVKHIRSQYGEDIPDFR
jgi:hypothetical protein